MQQDPAHFAEGLGKHHEPEVGRIELGIDHPHHDGVNILQDAEDLNPGDIGGIVQVDRGPGKERFNQ